MKPLHEQAKCLIRDANAEDVATPDAQVRIWDGLLPSLDAPLPPLADAAQRALGSGTSAGAGTSAGTSIWSGALLKVVVVGALGGGAVWYGAPRFAARAPMPRVEHAEPPSARVLERELAPPAEPEATSPPRAVVVPAAPAAPSARRSPPGASRLQAETRLIAEAQRALNAGAPGRALLLIEQHRAEFPGGELASEREAARVLALCGLGRHADANATRERFAREWPDSLLFARVRAACRSTP
jgi:RNA polymerase sigma-70 factor (ECF subfamily)